MSCSSARFLRKDVLWFCRRSAYLKTRECRWAPYRMNTGSEQTDAGRRLQTRPANRKYPVTKDFRRLSKVSCILTQAATERNYFLHLKVGIFTSSQLHRHPVGPSRSDGSRSR